jgi:hypothetical protein
VHLRYSSREDHYSPILVKNVNVWGVSKYHGFFYQSDILQKNKIELWYAPTSN